MLSPCHCHRTHCFLIFLNFAISSSLFSTKLWATEHKQCLLVPHSQCLPQCLPHNRCLKTVCCWSVLRCTSTKQNTTPQSKHFTNVWLNFLKKMRLIKPYRENFYGDLKGMLRHLQKSELYSSGIWLSHCTWKSYIFLLTCIRLIQCSE